MEANFFQEIKFFNIKSENPCFIAASSALKDLVSITDQLAFSKSPVLITGEKGSGKESFALQMGLKGVEQGKKFFIVDCRKYSNLNEFDTDFSDKKIIFFKEIGFLDENAQNKLLHLIQKINENRRYSKIIASSSDNLENFVSENRFNKELFQCFNNLSIKIPSLRSRKKDITPLAEYFLSRSCDVYGKNIQAFSEKSLKALEKYDWPGNVSELKCVVERACILESQNTISESNLFLYEIKKDLIKCTEEVLAESTDDKRLKTALDAFKKAYVIEILKENKWNQTKAAEVLNVQRTYVAKLMNELKIRDEIKERRP